MKVPLKKMPTLLWGRKGGFFFHPFRHGHKLKRKILNMYKKYSKFTNKRQSGGHSKQAKLNLRQLFEHLMTETSIFKHKIVPLIYICTFSLL